MRVVVGLLPKLYLYPQLLLVLEVQLVLLFLVIAFVLVINNSIILQWSTGTAGIPGKGALKVTLPIAYTGAYSVTGCMNVSTGANDSRLMIFDHHETWFYADWTNGGHVDSIQWMSIGY